MFEIGDEVLLLKPQFGKFGNVRLWAADPKYSVWHRYYPLYDVVELD